MDDVLAFRRPWGFGVRLIRVPVTFWHGEDDEFSPVNHTRWLAERVPRATVEVCRVPATSARWRSSGAC